MQILKDKKGGMATLIAIVAVGIIAIIIAGLAFTTIVDVDTGYTSILVDPFANTIKPGPTGPVFVVGSKSPWVEVHQVPISTQTILMATVHIPEGTIPKAPEIEVLSKDSLTIRVDLNIRYNVQSGRAFELFQKYPLLDYEFQIMAIIRESVRNVVIQFNAVELMEKRQQLDVPLRDLITGKIANDSSLVGSINIVGIEILEIIPPEQFTQAIKDKLTAEQFAKKASFEREKTLIDADALAKAAIRQAEGQRESAIIAAEGQAKAVVIQAEANAQAIVVQAEAQRKAIDTVVQGIGGDHTDAAKFYLQIQTLKEMSQTGHITYFLVPPNGNFLLQLPRLPE